MITPEILIICIVMTAIVSFSVGHRLGRDSERAEPGAADEELIRWIARRRMIRQTQRDLERAYRMEVEREVSREP